MAEKKGRRYILYNILRIKNKRSVGKMPKEFIEEFINKKCMIMFLDDFAQGDIVEVNDKWLKLVEKNGNIRIVNIDMIKEIVILPEKKKK